MPGDKKTLPNAKAGADPDLRFTYNDLLEELRQEYSLAERKPGDVTASEMAAVTHMTERACLAILSKKVAAGELVQVRVRSADRKVPYSIFRKPG